MSNKVDEELGELIKSYNSLRDKAIDIITQFMRQGAGRVCVFDYGSEVKGFSDGGDEFEVISLWLNPDNEVEYHTDMDSENNYTDCAGLITELATTTLLAIAMVNINLNLLTFTNETFVGEDDF